ncbi:MAG TPA: hypothetical protein VF041_19580 [Gemmatimonadaceae bacterium]
MQRYALALPILAAALAACSDATAPRTGAHAMQVAFSTTSSAAARTTAPAPGVSADVTLGDSAHTLVITRAQLVVEKLELEMSDTATCGGGEHDDDCSEIERGPMIVDLPLTAGASSAIDVSVPAGTYRKLQFEVRAVAHGEDDASAFLAAHPDFDGVSLRVDGTFDGVPFTYTTALEAEVESEFEPPVVVDASGKSITVNVDLSTWFTTSAGVVIDPATALPGGPNEALVAAKIRASFGAFEDDDHDGHDDHGSDDSGQH